MGERKTEKRSVPYLYRWAARTGFELSLRLLRTYEVNRGRSCGYICFSETIDTIYNQSLGTEIPTKSSILAKKLKPTMLLEHSFEPLNRELPARQGFRGLQSTGPCIECKAIQPHPYPEKLKTPITQWYRHPNSCQAHRTLCGLFLLQPSKAEEGTNSLQDGSRTKKGPSWSMCCLQIIYHRCCFWLVIG
jgi:hypothetical protein